MRVIDACSDCGLGAGAHYCDCPRIAQAVAQSAPQPTAYDRAQAELVRRIEALEAEVAKLKAWSRPPELMCMICGTGFATDAHKTNHRCGRGAL